MHYLKEIFNTWWGGNTNHDTHSENAFDVMYHAKQLAKGLLVFGAGVLGYLGLSVFFSNRHAEKKATVDLAADSNSITSGKIVNSASQEFSPSSLLTSRSVLDLEGNEEVHDSTETPYRIIDAPNSNDIDDTHDATSPLLPVTVTGYQAAPEFQIAALTNLNFSSVASLTDGGFVVVWSELRNYSVSVIYGQLYNVTGQQVAHVFQVAVVMIDNYLAPVVTELSEGAFVVVWGNWVQDTIYARCYRAEGCPRDKFLVANGTGTSLSVAGLMDGSFVVVWSNTLGTAIGVRKVYRRRYNAKGQPLEQAIPIADVNTRVCPLSSVSHLSDGGFVVVWNGNKQAQGFVAYGILGQRYNSSGQAVGPTFLVTEPGLPLYLLHPVVSALIEGDFVVVWENHNLERPHIYGRRFDRNGQKIGKRDITITTNDRLSFGYTNTNVAGLGGGFVVVWPSENQALPQSENLEERSIVVGRYFNTAGQGGPVFQFGDSNYHWAEVSVTSLNNGTFVTTWLTEGSIRGRLFYPNQTLSLTKNNMEIGSYETKTVTPDMLWAEASLNNEAVKFIIDIKSGKFMYWNDSAAITKIYRHEIKGKKIRFRAGENKPSYSVSATDGMMLTTGFIKAKVIFPPSKPSTLSWLIPVLTLSGIAGVFCICAPTCICLITATGIYIITIHNKNRKLQRKFELGNEEDPLLNNDPIKLSPFIRKFTVDWHDVRLLKTIGRGGQATVYRARWSNKIVAFKVTHLDIFNMMSDFEKEAKIMLKSSHPNVVQLYKIAVQPNKIGLVMEFMPLGSLKEAMSKGSIAFTWESKWNIAYDLATVISFFHKKNIVHRDIKPDNLLLYQNAGEIHAKLADFGLSKIKQNTNVSVTMGGQGTYKYMAPEMVLEDRHYSEKLADVYAIGMTFVSLVIEAEPYSDKKNSLNIPANVGAGKFWQRLTEGSGSPLFFKLTNRCRNITPNDRPTAKEIVQQLDKIREKVVSFGESINFAEEEVEEKPQQNSITTSLLIN